MLVLIHSKLQVSLALHLVQQARSNLTIHLKMTFRVSFLNFKTLHNLLRILNRFSVFTWAIKKRLKVRLLLVDMIFRSLRGKVLKIKMFYGFNSPLISSIGPLTWKMWKLANNFWAKKTDKWSLTMEWAWVWLPKKTSSHWSIP